MSPLVPKEPPPRTATAFSEQTVTPITQQQQAEFSIDAALSGPTIGQFDSEAHIRRWTPQQVVDWLCKSNTDASVIESFEVHDVNGAVLLALRFEDLLQELDIQSFGKRHQLWDEICALRGSHGSLSPQPTPFQDISRPCTRNTKRSPGQNHSACQTPVDGDATPVTAGGKKRRGRKAPKNLDVVTPAESVSIVAIEQLLPKPHTCAKGERCAKWRKQQREIKQLQDENGLGRFPISPTKGGRIFVAGDPGNVSTAENIVPNVRKQHHREDPNRPTSDAIPSIVASSDLLGPGQLPPLALHPDVLEHLESRDPQDNVRQFLTFQHMQSPTDVPPSPPPELAAPGSIPRSESVPLFPTQYHQAYPSLLPPVRSHTPGPREQLRALPRLEIPRSASAAPNLNNLASAEPITSACRTASPAADIYRLGTPASEMDVPITAFPKSPIVRDASQSVPPNMQFRQQTTLSRSQSARNGMMDWRRPSMAMPALHEGEVFSPKSDAQSKSSGRPSTSRTNSGDSQGSLSRKPTVRDPAKHSPTTQTFTYGADCTNAGWMKKRKTKMLRHEWQDAHFRLKGTQLDMHESARLNSVPKDSINVDHYAVACSSVASSNKLSAAMKAFHIKNNAEAPKKGKPGQDTTAFAFQLVPSKDGDKKAAANGKTHHFAVKNKDERIDWMREIMLAKAVQQKGKGYEVEVNGVQA